MPGCGTFWAAAGYCKSVRLSLKFAARQENAMSLQNCSSSTRNFQFPSIAAKPKSVLALILSFACTLSLGIEPSAIAATPPAAKKPKLDPALKGLPITEMNAD